MEKDIDLLKRIANADELAFKHFYDKYVNKVYQFIFNFVRDKAEAEDITQIVFIKIWSKKSTIDSINSLDGFVFTIAHRSVIDYFRSSETNFKKKISNVYDSELLLSSYSVDNVVGENHIETIYKKALSMLPPKRREIFILSRHYDLTNKQIALKLSISIKTVENQMTSALNSLKSFFFNSDLSIIIFLSTIIFL